MTMVDVDDDLQQDSDGESSGKDSNEDGDMFMDVEPTTGVKRVQPDNEDHEESGPKAGQKKRKLKKANELKKLHKPPTVEELNRLRETENLFHSNLFRRQIEEMLAELELKSKHKVRVNAWIDKFKDWVLKMEDSEDGYDLSDSSWLKQQKAKVPFPTIKSTMKGIYKFRKPSNIRVIGSYSSKTMLGVSNVDIAVEIPDKFFGKEDYLNARYYYKRSIYLWQLGKHLKLMVDLVDDIRFGAEEGDELRPVLEITPHGKLSKQFKFIVHLVANKNSFRLNRFIPTRNNVRGRWFFNDSTEIDDEVPTPLYNSGVLRDLRAEENEDYLAEVLGRSSQLRDAVVLLKVWARQRESHLGYGGFTGHLLSFIIVYLLHIKKINLAMSSYQVIRTAWNHLSNTDWSKCGATLSETSSEHQPSLTDFHANFPVVFVDPSGFLNLCAGMSVPVFQRFQDEAALALKCLDTPDFNSFQILFMTPAPFSRLCDQAIVFHNWSTLSSVAANHSPKKDQLDQCGAPYPQVKKLLTEVLTKGLGERVRRVVVKQTPRRFWPIEKKPKQSNNLTLGIILDPENCYSQVDKGPVGNADEAAEFRKFWGEKAELRRFKDGTITESVLWDAKSWKEKRMISRQISWYLLKIKFGLDLPDYHYVGDELESFLPKERESQVGEVHNAYDSLMKTLRGLKDLPLDIISVQGSSSVFRYSDVFPPTLPNSSKTGKGKKRIEAVKARHFLVNEDAHAAPPWCATADVVIQLGSSNKWPRELEAVRRIRAAFNIKIAELLEKSSEGFMAQAHPDWVDVLTEVCVFRLRIVYPGEIGLMKKNISPEGVTFYRDTPESLQLERSGFHLPKLTSALSGLQSQFSAFGPACCLAKRWVRSHLFHERHISDEVIDLLTASVFVNPLPWEPPTQPQLAFLRFLSLLSNTNWTIEFILLNFNQVLSGPERQEIEKHFDSQRSTLPIMFTATPDDRTNSVWTKDGPSSVVLLRLATLAQKTLTLLETQLLETPKPDLLPAFTPATAVFDVLISLFQAFVPKLEQAIPSGKSETNLTDKAASTNDQPFPVLAFDPVALYLKQLTESYGEWALFFHDSYGGTTIGVTWKPSTLQPRDFKVSHLFGRKWDRANNSLLFDQEAILEGFYILGSGIVKSVQIKNDNEFVVVPH